MDISNVGDNNGFLPRPTIVVIHREESLAGERAGVRGTAQPLTPALLRQHPLPPRRGINKPAQGRAQRRPGDEVLEWPQP